MPCYFGNTVTAHCTPDGHFSIAVSRDATLPPVILNSVQLASGHSTGCVPVVKNNAFVVYHFPLPACGTTFQVTGDQVIYENVLVASRDVKTGRLGSVTRDSTFRLHVRCSYSTTGSFIPLSVQVFTLPPLLAVPQPGPLSLELRVASDGSYTSFQTQLVPLSVTSGLLFPSHYQRFTLYTFTFVDSTYQEMLSGLVYLHCSASVCHRSVQESCTTTCPAIARDKRSAEHPLEDGASHVCSKGPVIFLQDEIRWDTAKDGLGADVNAAAPWALGFAAAATGAALCMVFVAAVLWCRKRSVMHEIGILQL
ncbi:LOW QUALITY PROTEIN: zona pellucida sperm-binding protein 4-like [Pezoporus occidentalis]|uniref:LOW QUALITY PROTEIN: zona pellucida sperm-binding protein 4-like n=1 Tax=Pezoporus occidentalis TaxID=407982 RepID=UPI002F912E59